VAPPGRSCCLRLQAFSGLGVESVNLDADRVKSTISLSRLTLKTNDSFEFDFVASLHVALETRR